jgi:hypothetical protein
LGGGEGEIIFLFINLEISFLTNIVQQGFVWILEPEKIPKIDTDLARTSSGGAKDTSGKTKIVEVAPVKKYAKIEDHLLIISDLNGTKTTIELQGCSIVAVSSSDLSSSKWSVPSINNLTSYQHLLYHTDCYFINKFGQTAVYLLVRKP